MISLSINCILNGIQHAYGFPVNCERALSNICSPPALQLHAPIPPLPPHHTEVTDGQQITASGATATTIRPVDLAALQRNVLLPVPWHPPHHARCISVSPRTPMAKPFSWISYTWVGIGASS
eukprot:9208615-Pyramimonas_sp.AAC.2